MKVVDRRVGGLGGRYKLFDLFRRRRTPENSSLSAPVARASVRGATVIIGVHAGGLGDNLAYSALPRLYKGAGARRVLISTRTNYGEPLSRNPEVLELVWRSNPFVDGITDEAPNVGETGWPPTDYFHAAKRSASPIDTTAMVHGLGILRADGTRLVPPKPDLFYAPKPRADFSDKIICDPRSISQGFGNDVFARFVEFIVRWHRLTGAVMVIDSRHAGAHGADILPDAPRYMVGDLREYIDVISSAKAFLVTEAGGQSLAAATRSAGTFVLITTRAFNERNFLWPGNCYCATGRLTPDEWA
jgi:hypothetical protein